MYLYEITKRALKENAQDVFIEKTKAVEEYTSDHNKTFDAMIKANEIYKKSFNRDHPDFAKIMEWYNNKLTYYYMQIYK
jgi:hypothetical protein